MKKSDQKEKVKEWQHTRNWMKQNGLKFDSMKEEKEY